MNDLGFDGVGNGMAPRFANVCNFTAHANAVNFSACCQSADNNWDIVFFAFAIDHIGKQKCFAVWLGNATAKLPTYQGVKFSVFVDGSINGNEKPLLLKLGQVFVKIAIASLF